MDCAYNVLNSNKFIFRIDRIPETSFFVQAAEIPDVSIPSPSGLYIDNSAYVPGSQIEFGDLTVEFTVDENMKNYIEVFNWLTECRFDNRIPKPDRLTSLVSDGFLIVLDNSSNPNLKVMYHDLFPISMSRIGFSTEGQPQPITCTVDFKYTRFTLENI